MSKTGWLVRLGTALGLLGASATAVAYTGAKWNLPQGVTAISHEVYGLHMAIFWLCVVIGVAVFGVMFYSVFAHRKSKGHKPANFHESTTVEIIWTVVPFIILIGMAIPAAGTLIKMEDTRNSEVTIKVTGYQWKWHYQILDADGDPANDVAFFSTLAAPSNKARQLKSGIDVNTVPNYLVEVDNELVLPVGKKVRVLITANDVLHAWWVPELAVKKDAIPGYINEVWFKIEKAGTYRGVCAELCGRDHGFMPIVVKAVPEAEYLAWLAEQKGGATKTEAAVAANPAVIAAAGTVATDAMLTTAAAPAPAAATATAAAGLSKEELVKTGEKAYLANCSACHQATGKGLPPTFPAIAGGKFANGDPKEHIVHTLKGAGVMPAFAHLSDADLAAIITYERVSWGNKGSIVQAADVKALR